MPNRKGINASNYRHGIYININRCIDCKKKIVPETVIYGKHRCKKCAKKLIKKVHICQTCGINISKQATQCASCAKKEQFKNPKNHPMYGKIAHHGKGEYYKNIYMRSSYEIKFAKWCDKNKTKWLYEPKTFDLGNSTYTPDFYLPDSDTYVEIKGWWRDRSKEKFKVFKSKYGQINIIVLMKEKLKILGVL